MEIKEKANSLLKQFKEWSELQSHVTGVALVGSFARGDFHPNSDIDLVIISSDKDLTLRVIKSDFNYGDISSYQIEEWGILTSLRVFYENGLEVEYGVVTNQWVEEPLDQGTRNVVKNGFQVVNDKEKVFSSITRYLKNNT